jgi:RNA polymerase sigma-70 factor (ECF subfamily)
MSGVQAGDAAAARRLFDRFAQRLIGLARSRLPAGLRDRLDPEDVAQSVWKSFFRRQGEEPVAFAGWDNVWAWLVFVTGRKCGRWAEHFRAQCRDQQREQPSADGWADACSREPTPEEAAILTETLEALVQRLDGRDRHILELHLQGRSVEQISEAVKLTERSVQRVLKDVRDWLDARATETAY